MSKSSDPSLAKSPALHRDPTFQEQVDRLQQVLVTGRWLGVIGLWATVGVLSLWSLRHEIPLWFDYFTWVAVRYGLAYHRLAAIGLGLCVGITLVMLLRQSRTLLVGRPQQEQRRLEQQVLRIRQQGPSHPLWQQVCGE